MCDDVYTMGILKWRIQPMITANSVFRCIAAILAVVPWVFFLCFTYTDVFFNWIVMFGLCFITIALFTLVNTIFFRMVQGWLKVILDCITTLLLLLTSMLWLINDNLKYACFPSVAFWGYWAMLFLILAIFIMLVVSVAGVCRKVKKFK